MFVLLSCLKIISRVRDISWITELYEIQKVFTGIFSKSESFLKTEKHTYTTSEFKLCEFRFRKLKTFGKVVVKP